MTRYAIHKNRTQVGTAQLPDRDINWRAWAAAFVVWVDAYCQRHKLVSAQWTWEAIA